MTDEANSYKLAGNEFFNLNNYKAAIKEYLKGLEFNCKSADLHSNLSAAYFHMENYLEAKEHGLFALFLKPEWYKSYTRVAKALQGQGEAGNAVKCLEEGLQHVEDVQGKKEMMKLIDEYKRDPSYTAVKKGCKINKSKKANSENVEPQDSDSDCDSDLDLPYINNSIILKERTAKTPSSKEITYYIEDHQNIEGDTCLHSSKKEVKEMEEQIAEDVKVRHEPIQEPVTDNFIKTICDLVEEQKAKNDHRKIDDKSKSSEDNNENVPLTQKDYLGEMPRLDSPTLPKELQTLLSSGFQAAQKCNYNMAIESYRAARDFAVANESLVTTFETHIIHYALNVVGIELGTYDELVQAMHNFQDMASNYYCCTPAAHYNCARIYYKLNRHKEALEPLQECLDFVSLHPFMKHFWPGSTKGEFFVETTRSGLKEQAEILQQLCRVPPAVTALCRYPKCLTLSTHIAPSTHIYSGDPDFIGYVTITCQEKCRIEFHVNCWKSLRDDQISKVSKVSDKDMLGRPCITEDCVSVNGERSVIVSISKTDQDGQVKTNMKYEPITNKASDQNLSKKSKKKRSKSSDEKSVLPKASKSKVTLKKKEVPVAGVKSTNTVPNVTNLKKCLQDRIKCLDSLRTSNFGISMDEYWNPQCIYYGNEEEQLKKENKLFIDLTSGINTEENANGVKEAKEFLFSYYHSILETEGYQKMQEIEEKWMVKNGEDDPFDIKTILPNMKSICDVLLESTRFCLLDENICLSDQLCETYDETKVELVESVDFILKNPSENNPMKVENGMEPIDCIQAPLTQILVAPKHVVQEPPSNNSEQHIIEPNLQELQNVYFSDETGDTEDEPDSFSDVEQNEDLEEVDNNFEEEDEISPTLAITPLDTLGILNSVEHSPMNILDYVNSTGNNQLNISELLMRFNSKTNELSAQPEPKVSTCDTECQTDDSELQHNIKLSDKIKSLLQEVDELKNSLIAKNTEIGKLELSHNKQIQKLEGEKCKILEKQEKNLKRLETEYSKKETALKKENEDLQVKNKELTNKVTICKELVKQAEEFQKLMQKAVGDNMVKKHRAVLADLNSRKCFCELQIKTLMRRCVEKISENQNLLSSLCTADLKDLPCWESVQQNIKQWEDTILQVNRTETAFQEIYNQLNDKLSRGDDVDDMTVLKLGPLPDGPAPLQIDKLISNILERYEVKINQLQHIIANSQIALVNQQNPFYPHNSLIGAPIFIPPQPPNLFTYIPSDIPNSNLLQQIKLADTTPHSFHISPSTHLSKTTDTSNKAMNIAPIDTTTPPSVVTNHSASSLVTPKTPLPVVFERTLPSPAHSNKSLSLPDNPHSKRSSSSPSSFDFVPLDSVPSMNSITNNLENVKNKDKKQKPVTITNKTKTGQFNKVSKPPLVIDKHNLFNEIPNDKSLKKKKKGKQTKEPTIFVDKRLCKSPSPASSAEGMDFGEASGIQFGPASGSVDEDIPSDEDSEDWQHFNKKSKRGGPSSEQEFLNKPSNKSKLLDNLKIKFQDISLKELDEFVMTVREENDNSLSGLPVNEISSRVKRLVTERQLQRSSTLGLEKFLDGAWGGVKEQEFDWSNVAPDECIICFEPMRSERTTLECNHIFDTACIRKWLQEKSVCPLCIKFSTMPDEFPGLPD